MFERREVKKLSTQRTSSPRARSRSQRCEPINPAPPVTSTRFIASALSVLQNAPDGAHSILPVDLLAFSIGTSRVADSDLVDSAAGSGNFRRDFRFEAKPVLLQANTTDDLTTEGLVAGLHVCKI